MFSLQPPRHISTLPSTDVPIASANVCFEEKSGRGADSPLSRTLTHVGHERAISLRRGVQSALSNVLEVVFCAAKARPPD
jgi:hypothetical protein